MKRTSLLLGTLFVLAFVAGCSSGASDISEGGALDKHDQMQKATDASTEKGADKQSRD